MKLRALSLVALPIALGAFAISSTTQSSFTPASAKIGPSVRQLLSRAGATQSAIPIMVIMKEQADLDGARGFESKEAKGRYVYDVLRTKALQTQQGISAMLTERQVKFQSFHIMNALAVYSASRELIQELASREDVARIIANPSIEGQLPAHRSRIDSRVHNAIGDNIVRTGASRVWEQLNVRGENIVVAGQDTGVQWDHPALVNHYRGTGADGAVNHDFNWHDSIHAVEGGTNTCGYDTAVPCDDDQHGTHTMGTVVGDDGADNKIGMAPGAKWIACRNMDAGNGTPATYIECFEWFLAPYAHGKNAKIDGNPAMAPHVINNSWGCPPSEGCEGGEILPVLEAMKAAGIMVVVSAGNDGPGCGTIQDPPAFHTDQTFSVGAHNHRSDVIASFSSRGPSTFDGGMGPDVVAPGVSIRSAIPGGQYAQFGWSGTSMAGPHVAGQVALLWSAKPELIGNIDATTALIRKTAEPKTIATESCGGVPGTQVPNNTFGYGFINASAAISATRR